MKDKWISVNDKLPENSKQVLVHAPNCSVIGPVLIGEYYNDDGSWTVNDFADSKMDELVTHWQPIELPY
ncbi:MAG: DUF551 domain-containing protein [Bacteroidota bacterium]